MTETKRSVTILQIMPVSDGWYEAQFTGQEENSRHIFGFYRLVGLALVEVTWDNGEKHQMILPMSYVMPDPTELLESWLFGLDDKISNPNLYYFNDEFRNSFDGFPPK